jgi:hypothetical protein
MPQTRDAQIPVARSPWRLNFVWMRLIFVSHSTELASRHHSGTKNFDVILDFWEICTPLS